jgi:maleate cis-trans isomerase
MEVATFLTLENYTPEGVEKAFGNYWNCVDTLAREKAQVIVFGGAPVSAVLGRERVLKLLNETQQRAGVRADAPLEALIAAMKHLELTKVAVGSRWAEPVNQTIARYLEAGGIEGYWQASADLMGDKRLIPQRREKNFRVQTSRLCGKCVSTTAWLAIILADAHPAAGRSSLRQSVRSSNTPSGSASG